MRTQLAYPRAMDAEFKRQARPLVRAVAVLQLKLLLNAGRDLVLIPVALVAAALDLALLKTQPPRYFRATLNLGERSDRWIDVWSDPQDERATQRENVDALLARVEEAVRDPQSGARRARVLKRWAERQIARAHKRAVENLPPIGKSS